MYAAWCAINRSVCKAGSGRNTQGFLGLPRASQGYNIDVEDRQSSGLPVGRVLLTPRPRLARYTETANMHIPYVNSSAFLIIYFRMHPQRERTLAALARATLDAGTSASPAMRSYRILTRPVRRRCI